MCFILELLSDGWTIDDILREGLHLSKENTLVAIKCVQGFGKRKLLSKPKLLVGEDTFSSPKGLLKETPLKPPV